MASATFFKDLHKPSGDKSLILITKDMQDGKYKEEVMPVTALALEGRIEEADELKKKLLAFTPSGTFEGGIKPNCLKQYSGFIVLDYDKLTAEQYITAFKVVTAIPYTFCCFRSPKGNGFKILVEVTSTKEHHKQAYNQLANFFEHETGIAIDRSGSNINRLCFVSYDPDMYRNFYCEKFPVMIDGVTEVSQIKIAPAKKLVAGPVENNTYGLLLEMQVNFTNAKVQFIEGSRNIYVFTFACNCNRAGIPEEETLDYCLTRLNYNEIEVRSSVNSAYKNNGGEFAKFADFANVTSFGQKENKSPESQSRVPVAKNQNLVQEDYLKNTPVIPTEIYRKMPDIIKDGARVFTQRRERDVFLTGALSILSGCLPGVKGVYDGQEVYPNLFSFVVAPAASGKGALKFAKMLADVYHNTMLKTSREADRAYNAETAVYKQQMKSKKKNEGFQNEEPVKPPFKIVFIPANSSYAKIIWHLEQNSGNGIICETEADTLGNIFKQDWGSYSDMLRKAFHHEKISSSKKGNNEFIEVDNPRISIALSGTPSQVTGLIPSAEDGLFSRFLFYVFKATPNWKDVSPKGSSVNFTEHFRDLSKKIFQMIALCEQCLTEITLSQEQWEHLNRTCEQWLNVAITFTAEETGSVIKRLGLIIYRMAMIFTAIRKFEKGDMSEKAQCTDEDFNVAVKLSEIYMHHSILMFNNLPKQEEGPKFTKSNNKLKFFESLPEKFTRAEAITQGTTLGLSVRTVDDLLRDASDHNFLTKPVKIGAYQKT